MSLDPSNNKPTEYVLTCVLSDSSCPKHPSLSANVVSYGTTSDVMLRQLANHDCPGNHVHTQIAGSVHHDGKTIPVSSFCATYCHGFAETCSKLLCEDHSNMCQTSFVHEDEPPTKRFRFDPENCKRRRVSSSVPADAIGDQPNAPVDGTIVASESLWHEACRMANRLAPRVGNHKYEADSDLGELVQQTCG